MSKVDIIRKHIGSDDFYDLNGTEMLSNILAAMDEYAQEQVKLFAIPVVSNSVVCKINMRPENCYYRDITMECKGCRNNANNCC